MPIVLTLWIHFWRSLTYVMKNVLTQMKQPVKIIFFLCLYCSPLSFLTSTQLVNHDLTCVWKLDWQCQKVIEICLTAAPTIRCRKMWVGVSKAIRPSDKQLGWSILAASGPSCLINTHIFQTAPQVCKLGVLLLICCLQTQGEISLMTLWWYHQGFFSQTWQSSFRAKEDITQLSLQAEED